LILPAPALAQPVPFAFLIQNGWQTLFQNQAVRIDHQLTTWATRAPFYSIVNGQKGPLAGNALVNAWSRTVAEPYFAPLGSLAGVVTLDFGTFRGHLALVETPGGLLTTIAIMDSNGVVNPTVTGAWVYGNGTSVGGGTANDMVVAGLVRFGSPTSAGTIPVDITQYFPTSVPFATDPQPFLSFPLSPNVSVGSFFGYAQGPLRTYRRVDMQGPGVFDDVSLMVMSTGGGNYAVMVCTDLRDHPTDGYLNRCTVSGTGPFLGYLSGRLSGRAPWWVLFWELFFAP
jgi:hypothetical protein